MSLENITQTFNELVKATGPEYPVERIDDRYYGFRVFLFNDDGNIVRIRRASIQNLTLVDELGLWHYHGHIVIQNPDEVLERTTQRTLKTGIEDVLSYRFRGDGRDYILIEFSPLDGDDIQSAKPIESEVYKIRHFCAIHNIEDLATGEYGDQENRPEQKLKKLTFHDYNYQLLLERNAFYSTGQSNRQNNDTRITTPLTQMSNTERERSTGDIIKDIITGTLPEIDIKFDQDFNLGSTKTFFTSSATSAAATDINSILARHITETHEKCLLRQERTTGVWSFLPISEYFNRALDDQNTAGPWLRERLTIGSQVNTSDETTVISRVPVGGVSISSNLHFPDQSVVEQYLFYDTDAIDVQRNLSTRPVHYKDNRTGRFSVSIKDNEIESVRDDFQNKYITNLTGDGKQGGASNNIIIDDTRRECKNISVRFTGSNSPEKALTVGKSSMLQDAIFSGNVMQYTVKGDTTRRSGRFFSLDRPGPYLPSDYDDKVLGLYLITKTVHRITPFGYTNDIIGLKPYSFKDMKFREDIP